MLEFDPINTIAMDFISVFKTENVIIDAIFRSFVVGILVSLCSNFSTYLRTWLNDINDWILHAGWYNKFNQVELKGAVMINRDFIARHEFSTSFEAVIGLVLEKCLCSDANRNLIYQLVEFEQERNIVYNCATDNFKTVNNYSFIVDQARPIEINNNLRAIITSNLADGYNNENNKQSIVSKREYTIKLCSRTLSCSEIKNWIDQTTSDFINKRRKQLQTEKRIVRFEGYCKDDGNYRWAVNLLPKSSGLESVFFEGKREIVSSIRRFLNEEEFYKSVGKPWQLGILLSGKPGCGKTSFIRALANELNRNIKDINFGRIVTNEDLRSAFHCIQYNGIELQPDKTIIVGEDIDCCNSGVLLNRAMGSDDEEKTSETNSEFRDEEPEKIGNVDKDDNSLTAILKSQLKADMMMNKKLEENTKIQSDSLSLSALLNCLDGINTMHGRVIVCTTNYPERLDSAFTRPGRFDFHIKLKPWDVDILKESIRFWYEKYSVFLDRDLVDTFEEEWSKVKYQLSDKEIKPCDAQNILQKYGPDVHSALQEIVEASYQK